ncbi:MAG TPA: hypothetical protein VNK92_08185, partial [Vicinamibacterales bacterium]|nr:hypothetical protein [Vicinamibacterales bacterium]
MLISSPGTAAGQCPQPNGNDREPDTAAIQCLLDQGGTVVLDADTLYAYYIAPPGLVLRTSGTTLTSTSRYGYRALLEATTDLQTPILRVEDWVSNYTISRIWFYGNKYARRGIANCTGDQTDNLWLRGSYFLIDDIAS